MKYYFIAGDVIWSGGYTSLLLFYFLFLGRVGVELRYRRVEFVITWRTYHESATQPETTYSRAECEHILHWMVDVCVESIYIPTSVYCLV